MGWAIRWLDEDLHIYDSVVDDPFTPDDFDAFLDAWLRFVTDGPSPLFGLLDFSGRKSPNILGLLNPRFMEMTKYRDKIRIVAVVPGGQFTASLARMGASMLGHRDWMHLVRTRDEGIAFLKAYAARALAESAHSTGDVDAA
jgi:hypothetical protein